MNPLPACPGGSLIGPFSAVFECQLGVFITAYNPLSPSIRYQLGTNFICGQIIVGRLRGTNPTC